MSLETELPPSRRTRRRVLVDALLVVVALVVIAVPSRAIVQAQQHSTQAANDVFVASVKSDAGYLSITYASVLRQQEALAAQQLTVPGTSPGSVLGAVVTAFGFDGGVVAGTDGSLAASVAGPDGSAAPAEVLQSVSTSSDGGDGVSDVLTPGGTPVVAFTVHVPVSGGSVLVSGTFAVQSPVFTRAIATGATSSPYVGYLVDSKGAVVGSAPASAPSPEHLGFGSNGLADLDRVTGIGTLPARDGTWTYATSPVEGTPWLLVLAEPSTSVYSVVTDRSTHETQLLLAGYGVLVLVALLAVLRFVDRRDRLRILTERLDVMSRTDPLTGVYNRRQIDAHLRRASGAVRSGSPPLTVLMLDIDHFKAVNDTYGHLAGDQVLCAVAAGIRSALRSDDVVGRWGGEEFLVVLGGAGSHEAADVAERIRRSVADTPCPIDDGRVVPVTVSVGVASRPAGDRTAGDNLHELIRDADAALYAAKDAGRNRVVLAADLAPRPTP